MSGPVELAKELIAFDDAVMVAPNDTIAVDRWFDARRRGNIIKIALALIIAAERADVYEELE